MAIKEAEENIMETIALLEAQLIYIENERNILSVQVSRLEAEVQ